MSDALVFAGLFWVTNEGSLNTIFIQVSSDNPNVNLTFIDILGGKRKDAEMNDLISIGTCVLHTIHCAFQHGKDASK